MDCRFTDAVKEGLVSVKIKSVLVSSKKSRWLRLCRQSFAGHCRLEFYEDRASSQIGTPLHVVPLYQGDRAMIYSKKDKCGVLINFRDGSSAFKFTTQSLYDAEVWMQLINEALGVQYPTLTRPKTPLPCTPDVSGWSTFKKRQTAVFHVKVLPCPALTWKTSVQCRLEISTTHLSLLTLNDPAELLVSWSIDSIVRYGQDQNCFIVETDSHSPTGEARVRFVSFEAIDIYQKFQEMVKTHSCHMLDPTKDCLVMDF